jgi:uncharacterized protein with HEPN domain
MLLEAKKYLHDILISAQDIEEYIGNMGLDAFRNQDIVQSAVER